MKRMLIKWCGIYLCSISLTVIVIYFNLIIYGCNIWEYIRLLLTTFEFYFFIPGIYLIKRR